MHLLKPRLPGVLQLLQDACAATSRALNLSPLVASGPQYGQPGRGIEVHLLKHRLLGVLQLLQDAYAAMFIGHVMICSLPQSKGKVRMAETRAVHRRQLDSSPVYDCLPHMQQAAMWLQDPCTLPLCFQT